MRHSVGQDATEVVREELIYVIYERSILLSIESPPEQRFTCRAVSLFLFRYNYWPLAIAANGVPGI